jgi:Virulence factor
MAEVQVTRWREIPSMVTARDGDEVVKIQLSARLQEAIDEAAMRLGAEDADAYLEGWSRDPWTDVAGSATQAAETVGADLEARWTPDAITSLLDSYGPGTSGDDA